MCGIAGVWSPSSSDITKLKKYVTNMLDTLSHRGPDGSGTWSEPSSRAVLGHRRLSIFDLSENGTQPMESQDGRYVLSYNGEIYNFHALAKKLEQHGVQFVSSSDTEVLVELIAQWGLDKTLTCINGMFAIALWDKQENALYLIRDRLGVKPLYWTKQTVDNERSLAFASEIKALLTLPNITKEIDHLSLESFFDLGYVPESMCIFKDVSKIKPGSYIKITTSNSSFDVQETAYWSVNRTNQEADNNNISKEKPSSYQESFEHLFTDAVKLRTQADVPVGCFLSGGIDSSLVTAIMQNNRKLPVRTYSVGFEAVGYDEADFACTVASYLGTDHKNIYMQARNVPTLFSKAIFAYDEPFADSSQLPMLLVSQLAAKDVTVVLSGDAGDEIFAGYNRHIFAHSYLTPWLKLPYFARKVALAVFTIAKTLSSLPLIKYLPKKWHSGLRSERFSKLKHALQAENLYEFYQLCTKAPFPQKLLKTRLLSTQNGQDKHLIIHNLRTMQKADLTSYLPSDVLTKVDRATMAFSLEARGPFLDYRIVELGLKLPDQLKVSGKKGKIIVRQLLEKYIPSSLFKRPKTGFGVPLEVWFKKDLEYWVEEILQEIKEEHLLDRAKVLAYWRGLPPKMTSQQAAIIWRLLVWIKWYENYG